MSLSNFPNFDQNLTYMNLVTEEIARNKYHMNEDIKFQSKILVNQI